MEHHKDCVWENTTSAECEYRDTHHYCPHPKHECNCISLQVNGNKPVRQDVHIEVKRLNIENRTPEDTAAEEKIIDAMSKRMVRVVVIHKPDNEFASFESPVSQVRIRAKSVVEAYNRKLSEKLGVKGAEAPTSEFVVVEYDADQIRVTSL